MSGAIRIIRPGRMYTDAELLETRQVEEIEKHNREWVSHRAEICSHFPVKEHVVQTMSVIKVLHFPIAGGCTLYHHVNADIFYVSTHHASAQGP